MIINRNIAFGLLFITISMNHSLFYFDMYYLFSPLIDFYIKLDIHKELIVFLLFNPIFYLICAQ